ncbi:MAG: 23S rRNA (guanosine(2251)-2'-O)-methyltransferase RlmB [Candidatus Aminicenantes bacterium]|nr:23S rRNA (guanosine(2251)-2'-O)-methyltransferase RlmB [Candidatus Aminicenantes bacterium]
MMEVVKSSPRRVQKILVQQDSDRRKIAELLHRAKLHRIPLQFVPRKKLDILDRNHQGVIGFLSLKAFVPLDEILEGAAKPFLLLCDGVEDPQNLGAIIRTAECSGADGLILPERRSAGISSAVLTVSAGAAEHLSISRVKNLARTMDELRKRGIWLVGAEGGGREYWFDFDYNVPVGLVLGSEGKGLRPLVRDKCDRILSIPLAGQITSLNVAAAAAVFMFEVVRQRKKFRLQSE